MLVIRASPRPDGHSNRVASRFIEVYQKARPRSVIKEWWLHSKLDIPEFGQAAINGSGEGAAEGEQAAWRQVLAVIGEFGSADKYVVATPMWNFGVPAKLKNLVDVSAQSGHTFEWLEDGGSRGLLAGKKVLFICARAGEYELGSRSDFQLSYLQKIWGFMGVHEQREILIQNTWMGPESDEQPLRQVEACAREW